MYVLALMKLTSSLTDQVVTKLTLFINLPTTVVTDVADLAQQCPPQVQRQKLLPCYISTSIMCLKYQLVDIQISIFQWELVCK